MQQRFRILLYLLVISQIIGQSICLSADFRKGGIRHETRALWVTRWDFSSPDDILRIMQNAAASRFNVILFQVRGAGTVYFRSSFEPSALSDDHNWDPLQTAIKAAHRYHLELHAWVNVYPGWSGTTPPDNPMQLWNAHPDWFIADADGKTLPLNRNYTWLSPTHPKARIHIAQVLCELIKRYNIDGLHLDYCRFPGPGFSYDSLSVTRFETIARSSNRNIHDLWNQYRRDGITQLISAVHMFIQRQKPSVAFSCAVVRNRDIGRRLYFQDGHKWLARGDMDFLTPMIYTGNDLLFSTMLSDHLRHAHGRHIFPGIMVNDAITVARQIELCRELGTPGHCLFSYNILFPRHKPGSIVRHLQETVYSEVALPVKKLIPVTADRPLIHDVVSIPDPVVANQPFNLYCTIEQLPKQATVTARWGTYPDSLLSVNRYPMTRINGSSNRFITSYTLPAFPAGTQIYLQIQTSQADIYSDIIPVTIQARRPEYVQTGLTGPLLYNAEYTISDAAGNVWICEQGYRQIRVFDTNGRDLPFSPIRSGLSPNGQRVTLPKPCGIAINQQGIVHVATNSGHNAIFRFLSKTGAPLPALSLSFWPGELDIDANGHIYIIESDGNAWHLLDAGGRELRHSPFFGSHLSQGIAVNPEGTRVYVACRGEGTVHCWSREIAGDSTNFKQTDDLPVREVGLGAVDVDQKGRIYVSQCDIGQVSIFDAHHQFIQYLKGTEPPLTAPRGVAISPDGKVLTIAEWGIDSSLKLQQWRYQPISETSRTAN